MSILDKIKRLFQRPKPVAPPVAPPPPVPALPVRSPARRGGNV